MLVYPAFARSLTAFSTPCFADSPAEATGPVRGKIAPILKGFEVTGGVLEFEEAEPFPFLTKTTIITMITIATIAMDIFFIYLYKINITLVV
jgi:hypothetical protein